MRKSLLGLLLLSTLIFISGCETVKNTALGAYYIGKGMADDTYNTYSSLKKADRWLQENYW